MADRQAFTFEFSVPGHHNLTNFAMTVTRSGPRGSDSLMQSVPPALPIGRPGNSSLRASSGHAAPCPQKQHAPSPSDDRVRTRHSWWVPDGTRDPSAASGPSSWPPRFPQLPRPTSLRSSTYASMSAAVRSLTEFARPIRRTSSRFRTAPGFGGGCCSVHQCVGPDRLELACTGSSTAIVARACMVASEELLAGRPVSADFDLGLRGEDFVHQRQPFLGRVQDRWSGVELEAGPRQDRVSCPSRDSMNLLDCCIGGEGCR